MGAGVGECGEAGAGLGEWGGAGAGLVSGGECGGLVSGGECGGVVCKVGGITSPGERAKGEQKCEKSGRLSGLKRAMRTRVGSVFPPQRHFPVVRARVCSPAGCARVLFGALHRCGACCARWRRWRGPLRGCSTEQCPKSSPTFHEARWLSRSRNRYYLSSDPLPASSFPSRLHVVFLNVAAVHRPSSPFVY